ncbi:unnamed protein product [Brugia timori]|uniref:Uncharacterized protein n=1 Tax=Brugia timori TaxID=42155 RepID=A0A3P7Z1E5_9BILA|nr:unnamed protein product [Brugia timori]
MQTTLLLFGCAIGSLFLLLRTFGLMRYIPCIALIEILKYYTIEVFPLIFLVFSGSVYLLETARKNSMKREIEHSYRCKSRKKLIMLHSLN